MKGITDLANIISNLSPVLDEREYVYLTFKNISLIPPVEDCHAVIKENEGYTVILDRKSADLFKLEYDDIFRLITLNVHSNLNAVGLTSIISTELASAGISCNMIAGFYHDHIFIPGKDAEKAFNILIRTSCKNTTEKQNFCKKQRLM